ncbi:golgin subfamily A member 6-like protein 6 [Agrilus planipennis]|uniref:Golgin subfamily A member 6-like protein 6 n=1 Tax=Agrilus planipennis TaxID=224129 RepID=A0A1W4WVJ9_AGRPL|nr:golgin subfamily A member 6-like protein 6 [Agrilus planipennis]
MYYLVVVLIVCIVYSAESSGVTIGIQSYSRPIEHQYYSQDALGSYVYGYITPHSTKTEFRTHDGVTKGGYSYIDPNGEVQTVEYTADAKNGFRVATTNLPKDDPDVAYARHKHFEEFERIKAEHAALAAEHAALAAKLTQLTERDWSQGSIQKLLGSVHVSHSQGHDNSALERARNLHEQAYRAALDVHQKAALFNERSHWVENQNRHDDQEGQEKWEDTWEAQKLRDQEQQQNTESNNDRVQEHWINQGWNLNTDEHRAAIEATIAAEKGLIERANEERNRQIQALQQAQQLYQASLSRLQETRVHQHSIQQSSSEAHQEAARRLEEARLRQEEADRQWNTIRNNQNQWNTGNQDDQHRTNYEAVIRAEKEHIARAQEERNRQLQAYHEAIQRYRESESRLEHTRNEQTAAYQSALEAHRDASQRLQEIALQQEKAESYWNSVRNSQDHKGAYEAAINTDRQKIVQANELRDRQLQAYQQAQQSYQESARRLEESKQQQRDAYNVALESHREATRLLQETQQQKDEAEKNLYRQSWDQQNEHQHHVAEDQVRIVTEARKRALAEADRAFNEFTSSHISSNNLIRNDVPLRVKVYAPVEVVGSNKGVTPQGLDLYSYGSLKIPEIKATGGYSFIDNNGVLQTMQYVSNHLKGFRISDVNSALESITNENRKTTAPTQKVQAVDRQVEEITPQIHQEVKEGSIQESADWEGDSASYSTEIKYK